MKLRFPKAQAAGCRGMTMVELLVTLAVVGILGAIGFTMMAGRGERARVQEAVVEIESLSLAIARYATRPDRLAAGLPDELADLGVDPEWLTDPWGRPYQYFKPGSGDDSLARINARGARLNQDYDLFSLGPDGSTRPAISDALAADDILRAALGGFVGAAADYGPSDAVALQFSATPGGDAPSVGPSVGFDPR
jgi:general secretion pathway protein G